MDKFAVILFGRTTARSIFRWEYLKETLFTLDELDKETSLLIFQDEPVKLDSKEDVLDMVDHYHFYGETSEFQAKMGEHIKAMKEKGYSKILLLSCCHAINIDEDMPTMEELGIWDKRLAFYTDALDTKTLNHRFMYGDANFIEAIWSRQPFLRTRTVDENIYRNAKNVIGEENIAKHSYTDDTFNVTRIGWGTE